MSVTVFGSQQAWQGASHGGSLLLDFTQCSGEHVELVPEATFNSSVAALKEKQMPTLAPIAEADGKCGGFGAATTHN